MSQVVKPVKVSNADVPVNSLHRDMVESLKTNKEVQGMAKYVI